MAAKVNTKFVAILVGALVLLAGAVGGAAWMVLFKSAADLARQGDALMSAGKPTEAERIYGKAVNKEPTNLAYLKKWKESIEKMVPPTQTQFDSKYPTYTLVRKRIADLQRTDVQSHRDLLDVYLTTIQNSGYSRPYTESLVQATTDALAQYGDGTKGYGDGEVLRRYRALANLRIMTESKNLKEAEEQLIKADFEAALAADPGDVESVVGLHNWYTARADRLLNDLQRPDDAVKEAEKGRDLIRKFREKDPREPRTRMVELGWTIADARRQLASLNKVEDRKKVIEKLREEGKIGLDESLSLLKQNPATINAQTIAQLMTLESQLDDSGKFPRSHEVLDIALKANPNDAAALISKSEADTLARDFTAAITALQRVRDLPNPPLGVPGRLVWYRKNEALFRQAVLGLRAWEMSTDPDPAKLRQLKSDWLTKSKQYRAELAKLEPETSPRMMLIDGKIKLAEEDYPNAQRLLLAYLSAVSDSDADAMVSAATASFQLNQPGKAKELLERSLQINPYNVPAILILGEVQLRLKNLDAARALYVQADAMIPNNEQIKNRLKAIDQEKGTVEIDDPVLKLLAEYRRLIDKRDDKAAAQLLQGALDKTGYDSRVVIPAVQSMLSSNDTDGAKALLAKAIATNTKEDQKQNLLNAMSILDAGDAVQARIKAIDLSPLKPVEKASAKLAIYSAGGAEKYAAQIREITADLEKNYPDDPVSIESLFIQAIREKKLDTARRLVEKAVAKNIDTYDGSTFRARLMAAEGDRAGAISTLVSASQKFNFNVEAWRVLAAMQTEDGRTGEAASSMLKALELRPDDVTSILQASQALQSAGRAAEALTMMKAKAELVPESMAVRDEWLRLEGTMGDKETALRERERDLARDPNNRLYQLQVAALNVDLRRWEEARKRIESVRKAKDGLDILQVDATFSADQSDLPGANTKFRQYVDGLKANKAPNEEITDALIAMARFFANRDNLQTAAAALEEARQTQDPAKMQADRILAELYLDNGDSERAIEALRRIAATDKEGKEDFVRLRLAEALVQARKFDESEKELAALRPETKDGAVALLLRADAALGRGDGKKAMELLDKAVSLFPNNASVFLKRGQAGIELKRNSADVLADLDQALRLDPRLWQAHQLRAVIFQQSGRKPEVVAELKAILQTDPTQDEILGLALRMLMAEDRDDEAVALAEDVAKRRGSPGVLYANLGDLFATLGRKNHAIAFYKSAVAADSRTSHISRYVNLLLSQKPPNITEAEAALSKVQERIYRDPELLLSRAGVRRARNNGAESRRDVIASMKLVPPDQIGQMQTWFSSAFSLFGPQELLMMLEVLSKEGGNPDWVSFFHGRLLADDKDPKLQAAGIEEIGRIGKTTKIAPLAALASKEAAGRLYLTGQLEAASKAMKDIIAADPTDAETMNNLAYLLCKDLKQPKDALPYAKQAYQLRPKSPELLDTYGLVLMETGDLAEAQRVFDKASMIAATPSTQVTILLHLAELEVRQGKKEEAKISMNKARTLFGQASGPTRDAQNAEMERIQKLIDAP
ncbi:MAG: tetratricopeptide repeat protein [Phycisphaerales bacterium]|nr:tetratricopeptide repeat protein [Planctomycetota bacterium]